MKECSRREFFTSGSKEMLKDVFRAWRGFSEEKKKEETKLSCEEAAIRLFQKNSGKSSLNNTMFSMNRKEGKKI